MSRPPGAVPPGNQDDPRSRRFTDFQRAGVVLFVAGVLALGVGIATGSKADGKSTPAVSFTPIAQVVAPSNAGPDVPASPANVAPGPPANTAPPAPANSAPAGPQAPAAPPAPRGPGAPVPPQPSAPAPLGAVDLSPLEQKLYVLQNAFRNAQNVGALQLDPRLVAIARMRAQDMVARNYFAHTAPTGETTFGLLSQAGYLYTIAGENIARNNYPDAESATVAMDGFLNSASHRENVMDGRFKNAGVGVATGPDGMKYFAVVFAS